LSEVFVGTSGWSYPSWRPGFYPPGTDAKGFLAFYAGRFSTVELNTTGYRLPGQEQFERWAAQTPPGFTFAPKLAGNRPGMLADFGPRVRALGDRLGPIRVQLISARDEGMIELILGSLDPELTLAFDLAHPSWDGIEPRLAEAGAVRVNDLTHDAPFTAFTSAFKIGQSATASLPSSSRRRAPSTASSRSWAARPTSSTTAATARRGRSSATT